MEKQKTKFAVSGAIAGLINGFFGSGGGMALVPLYIRWLKMPERQAFASSVCTILPLCIVSSVVYFAKQAIDLNAAVPYLAGGLLGGILGGLIFKKIPMGLIRKAFALLIIYGGVRSLL
ncbi:MAG: sulfite exporter TauE/SafE family protein [Ruminococcaceae bacterium]|nr:sulfite exporter TauE/SafE family protein [Oscillospiraceae bacterium]